jgi:hypothetical protein
VNKFISIALVISQLFFATAGNCAPATTTTPEATLLTRVIALRGENLSQDQWKQESTAAFKEYNSTAQSEGRNDRLEKAFVSLGVYTPAQAALLMSQVQAAQNRIATLNSSTQLDTQQAIQTELGQVLRTMPQGAQFSGCYERSRELERIGVIAFIVGVAGIFAQGNDVAPDNWAAVTALSGFGIAVLGVGLSYDCN